MADGKLIFVAGASSVIGAVVTAIGHAFGINRRINTLESNIKGIKKRDSDFMTVSQCDDKIKYTEKIVSIQFDRHTAEIADLKRSQEKGFETIFDKLDRIIAGGS